MFQLTEIIDTNPFSLGQREKQALYIGALSSLTEHHYEKCPAYRQILDTAGFEALRIKKIEDVPFLPVRLFKKYDLLSVNKSEILKTMTSSGTTGQSVSKVFLDKETSSNQTKVLAKIVSSFIGNKRLPMLVIDSKSVIKDRNLFSARGAGILGFSMFGHDVTYALDDEMYLDISLVKAFLEKHKGEQILLFGFTYMIWEHFYNVLKSSGIKLELNNSVMIHGGGWKKLIEQSVESDVFKKAIYDVSGITKIYNYYGMVEQTGSIFMECEFGFFHSSIFSDVLIRKHEDFSPADHNQQGIVQLVSLLPLSYPGHSILTEDIGEICGEDNCKCGRMGKYFKIYGRIKNAEVRGCSDTYAADKSR